MTDGNNSKVNDLVRLQHNHAWKWFNFHGKQRTTMFNYFLIITGIFANALVASYKEGYSQIMFAISFLGTITSLGFLFFDIRNRDLVTLAADVLEKLERDIIYPKDFVNEQGKQLGPLLKEKETKMSEGQKRPLKLYFFKHKYWIRGIEGAVALCFVLSLILSITGNFSQRPSDVQHLQEQVSKLELATRDLANRIDKIQMPTTSSSISTTRPITKKGPTK